ncbi:MAG: hypothetical protein LBG58_10560 [Planctomycetaceae bacterium]|nr:hypothetical protein [Planctomycetaceae bacterium]
MFKILIHKTDYNLSEGYEVTNASVHDILSTALYSLHFNFRFLKHTQDAFHH